MEASKKLSKYMESQNKLSQNPNSVVSTDAYKEIGNREIFREDRT